MDAETINIDPQELRIEALKFLGIVVAFIASIFPIIYFGLLRTAG